MKKIIAQFLLVLVVTCADCRRESPKLPRKGDYIVAFGGERLFPKLPDLHVSYGLDPAVEKFFVHVPENYTGDASYGLIVFTDSDDDSRQLPDGWSEVLDTRKYIFVAAQNAGNNQPTGRRLGLAVLGALEMIKNYRVDLKRVYAAGFSGGARMSGLLGFYQADIFGGTIQNCGADFYKPVPHVSTTSWIDTMGYPYGILNATPNEIAISKHVRFVLITGSRDFRRGNILDIFNGGFAQEGFQAKLLDVLGMAHEIANAQTLSAALDFIEHSP